MSAVILMLAIAAMVGIGFLAVFVMLLVSMRTEGRHLSPSSSPHSRTESTARRILGLYVRRELHSTALRSDVRR
jgi:hypothetical protein